MKGGPSAFARHLVAVTDEMPSSAQSAFSSRCSAGLVVVGRRVHGTTRNSARIAVTGMNHGEVRTKVLRARTALVS